MEAAYRLTRRHALHSAGVAGLGLLVGCGVPFRQDPPPPKVHRIGWLGGSPPEFERLRLPALLQGPRDFGYVEGQNLLIEWRHGNGRDDQLEAPAAELLSLPVEVIVVPSATVATALGGPTATTPIVVTGSGDLVARGLAASLARPGGNVTGLSTPDLAGKALQQLQEAVPSLTRVAVLRVRRPARSLARPMMSLRAPWASSSSSWRCALWKRSSTHSMQRCASTLMDSLSARARSSRQIAGASQS